MLRGVQCCNPRQNAGPSTGLNIKSGRIIDSDRRHGEPTKNPEIIFPSLSVHVDHHGNTTQSEQSGSFEFRFTQYPSAISHARQSGHKQHPAFILAGAEKLALYEKAYERTAGALLSSKAQPETNSDAYRLLRRAPLAATFGPLHILHPSCVQATHPA